MHAGDVDRKEYHVQSKDVLPGNLAAPPLHVLVVVPIGLIKELGNEEASEKVTSFPFLTTGGGQPLVPPRQLTEDVMDYLIVEPDAGLELEETLALDALGNRLIKAIKGAKLAQSFADLLFLLIGQVAQEGGDAVCGLGGSQSIGTATCLSRFH